MLDLLYLYVLLFVLFNIYCTDVNCIYLYATMLSLTVPKKYHIDLESNRI